MAFKVVPKFPYKEQNKYYSATLPYERNMPGWKQFAFATGTIYRRSGLRTRVEVPLPILTCDAYTKMDVKTVPAGINATSNVEITANVEYEEGGMKTKTIATGTYRNGAWTNVNGEIDIADLISKFATGGTISRFYIESSLSSDTSNLNTSYVTYVAIS